MTRFNYTTTIGASKSRVWEVVADLGYVQNYNPGVTKSYYNTDHVSGVGAGRICELAPMGKIEEIATSWDKGESYTLNIVPIENVPPFKNATAHFTLKKINASETEVRVDFKYEMKLGLIGQAMDAMLVRKQFKVGIKGLIDGLKIHIEKGIIIKNNKTLKNAAALAEA